MTAEQNKTIEDIEIDCELEELWKIRPAKEINLICKAQGWRQQVRENQYG